MDPAQSDAKPATARRWLLLLSMVGAIVCAGGAACHYRKWAWGNLAHPIGWLLSMLFLFLAFAPAPRQAIARVMSALNARTAFFAAWVLIFTISRLWHFKTA